MNIPPLPLFNFFATIADLGLTLITVQMISGEKDNENKILNNLFSLRLVSALIFIGLAPLSVIFFPYSGTIKIGVLIAAASFVFPALNQVIVGLFQKNYVWSDPLWLKLLVGLPYLLELLLPKTWLGLKWYFNSHCRF